MAAGIDHLADLPAGVALDPRAWSRSATRRAAIWRRGRQRAEGCRTDAGARPRVPVTAVVAQAGVVDLATGVGAAALRGVVRRFLGGTPDERPERYATASPAARLPLGVPVLLTHGGLDDTVPPVMSARFAAAALEAGDRCELRRDPAEDHYGHLDPANPLWRPWWNGWRDRSLARRGARRRRSARGVPRAVRGRRRAAHLPGRQLARAAAAGDARPAARGGRRSGATARDGLARLDRRARRARATCSPRRARRRAGRGVVTDSMTVNLYKLVNAAPTPAAAGGLVTDRANFPTDRYVLEGIAAARGLELRVFDSDPLYGPQPADLDALRAPATWSCSRHVAYRSGALADMAALTAAARERGATLIWDLSHSAGAVAGRAARGAAPSWRSAAPTSTSTAAPARPRSSTSPRELQAELRSPIWGWFAPERPVRDGARLRPGARHRPLPRRHAADPPARGRRGGRAADRRGRHRAAAREVDRAHASC